VKEEKQKAEMKRVMAKKKAETEKVVKKYERKRK
jgi:hypothetical protein